MELSCRYEVVGGGLRISRRRVYGYFQPLSYKLPLEDGYLYIGLMRVVFGEIILKQEYKTKTKSRLGIDVYRGKEHIAEIDIFTEGISRGVSVTYTELKYDEEMNSFLEKHRLIRVRDVLVYDKVNRVEDFYYNGLIVEREIAGNYVPMYLIAFQPGRPGYIDIYSIIEC